MYLADIGVNLADKRFDADFDAVLERARQAGVRLQVITGTSVVGSETAIKLAAEHAELFCTAGVHPHHANEFDRDALARIREIAAEEKVRAIGETGLDFNRDFSPRPAQENAFAEQLQLASETTLPAFLHQRDAHDRFLPMLKEQRDKLPNAVVHCFTGSKKELFDYLDIDCHIGVTGWICDERRGLELQALVKNIPLNRLMIETDSPYLTPRNMDGKPPRSGRNEPFLLTWVLKKVAECYDCSVEEISQATWQNSLAFFGVSESKLIES